MRNEKKLDSVVYLISTLGHGRGGHFQSLNIIANEVSKFSNVYVINIGKNHSEVLNQSGLNITNIYFNGYNILATIYRVYLELKSKEVSHIHCFDSDSFLFARIINAFLPKLKKKPYLILSKCGGPNPTDLMSYCNNMHFMSLENYDYYNEHHNFSEVNYSLIPNRVSSIINDESIINEIRFSNSDSSATFIHIGRIGITYRDSFIQSLNLIKHLTDKHHNVRLLVIGVIQDRFVYEELVDLASKYSNIDFLTTDKYTIRASKCIDAADYVIGTGRSVMEGASKGKVILTPLMNESYPVVITDDNFISLFKTNFSPRNHISFYDEQQSLNKIFDTLNRRDKYIEYSDFMYSQFLKYFSVESAEDKFKQLYSSCVKHEDSMTCLIKNLAYTLKKYLKR
ncbi:glycosyltransferase family protein [Vibrio cyclitrophicus]|uniref:glycosyltransferase n=1 Tax=Vibrio cyclitrophicus TaxID=47951 RepID=UPI0002E06A65|nr:glycosyltransferase [Vibrio cyclitrophicus]OEF29286.1 hypothetical protein OA9_23615 [Vibrio cyclitrophicus 1F97]